MKIIKGNIWDYCKRGNWIIIPTNGIVKKNGECVMGKGLAKQAKERFPALPKELGSDIRKFGNLPFCYGSYEIITCPVKYNWKEQANLSLIEKSIRLIIKLTSLSDDILVFPKIGCGCGGLDWKNVAPILDKYLDEKCIIVDLK